MATHPSKLSPNSDFDRTVVFLVCWLIVGLIGILIPIPLDRPTAFLMALAAIAAGATFGFLFGIPRSNARGNPTTGKKAEAEGQPQAEAPAKTNLEEIADWLTKILLGAGLTQIGHVPAALESMASKVATPPGANSVPVVISLWIFFSVLGFFLGYLVTRLFLTGAFTRAESPARTFIAVAGETYSLEELLAEMRTNISDLQNHAVPSDGSVPEPTIAERAEEPSRLEVRSVLWVDESPPSEPSFLEKLANLKVTVSHAKLAELPENAARFDRIVFVAPAAPSLQRELLLEAVDRVSRAAAKPEHVVVFCTPESKTQLEDWLGGKVAGVTSSPVDLQTLLDLV